MSQPPQPPYSGEPYPGQPSSGQPYSGQPYQGQQYPGQTYGQQQPDPQYPGQTYGQQQPDPQYPGQTYGQQPSGQTYGQQPYSGQPNPDVPTSVPPQPGYPPTSVYPASGQPDYAQQGFGQPGYPPATPPKKKSKVLPIVLTAIAIVLVLCVGGVVAIYMIGKDKVDEINAQVNSSASTAPPKAVSTIKIVEPKTLGGRPKLTDAQFAGVAEELEGSLKEVPGATNTVGALYGTVEKQDIVIVAAAEAPLKDPAGELDEAFASAGVGGLKIENISTASTGTLGGVAKCGSAKASGLDMAICSWADNGSLGMIIWYFKSASKAKAEFPKLRAEIEKKS